MNTIIFGLRYELLEPALKRLLVVGHDYLLDLRDMNTCWEMTATWLLARRCRHGRNTRGQLMVAQGLIKDSFKILLGLGKQSRVLLDNFVGFQTSNNFSQARLLEDSSVGSVFPSFLDQIAAPVVENALLLLCQKGLGNLAG